MCATKVETPWDKDQGNYVELKAVGSGAYGTVFKAEDRRQPGKTVALKKIRIPLTEDGIPQSVVREITTLKFFETFEHENVIKLLDVCHGLASNQCELYLYMVFEYCECDLATHIMRCRSYDDRPAVKQITKQLLCGLDFLHSHSIVHRDVKPQNVLVSSSGCFKLTDFGLSRLYSFQTHLTPVVVTLWYRAPEVLLKSTYTSAVDIWSIGCIFCELYLLRAFFPGQSEIDQLQKILRLLGTPAKADWPTDAIISLDAFPRYAPMNIKDFIPDLSTDALQLLMEMFCFCGAHRISAKDAVAHSYFHNSTSSNSSPSGNNRGRYATPQKKRRNQ